MHASNSEELDRVANGDLRGVNAAVGIKPELRVLQVFSVLGVGGAETWLMALLKYFHANEDQLPFRLQMDVCLTGGSKAVFDEEAESLGARLFYLHYTRKKLVQFTHDFRAVLSRGRYHAIHDHQDYTAGWHFLSGLGQLPPVRIAHVHNPFFCVTTHDDRSLRRATLLAGKRLLSSLATNITGTSQEILNRYGFDHPSYAHVKRDPLYCGFDVSRYQGDYSVSHRDICEEFGWDDSVNLILFVGRLDTRFGNNLNQKNPEFAVEVARACIEKNPNVRMLMAGGGDAVKKELQDQIERGGLSDKIRLIGVRQDVPRLMLASDIFLFPSLEEGLGMVAVEAQAAGLRVLASDVVPREAVVVPDIVDFHSLDARASDWADTLLQLISLPRPDAAACNLAVSNSPFAIENSAKRLVGYYANGCNLNENVAQSLTEDCKA